MKMFNNSICINFNDGDEVIFTVDELIKSISVSLDHSEYIFVNNKMSNGNELLYRYSKRIVDWYKVEMLPVK